MKFGFKELLITGVLSLATYLGCTEYEVYHKERDPSEPSTEVNGREVTDTFLQVEEQIPVDLLMVIDNSCSMSDDHQALAYNVSEFLKWFEGSGTDYRIGVITTDMYNPNESGRLQGMPKIITPSTHDGADLLFTTIVGLGENGASTEKGRDPIYAALTEPLLSEENENFLRKDAKLHTLIVTDEPDNSEKELEEFLDWYELDLKLHPEDAYIHVVAMANTDYPYLASETNGNSYNIETWDWVTGLVDDLDTMLTGLEDTFCLSHEHEPGTLEVYVNSQPHFYDWDFEESECNHGAIVFEQENVPSPGSIIKVVYKKD